MRSQKLFNVYSYYLGSKITCDEKSEADIKSRIVQENQEEKHIHGKYCKSKDQKKSSKLFYIEYSHLWDRNIDNTKNGKKNN